MSGRSHQASIIATVSVYVAAAALAVGGFATRSSSVGVIGP